METVPLSLFPLAYDGKPQVLEVTPYSKDIHDAAGVYLQHREGCGYRVFDLTPAEAMKLGTALIQAAQQSIGEFEVPA
jgi:hypothetical protein